MQTLLANDEDLTPSDAVEYIGMTMLEFNRGRLDTNQRLGQFWYNQLDNEDTDKLYETGFDPYYQTEWFHILRALRFLLEN